MIRVFLKSLIFILVFIYCSCFDYVEEIEFNKDFSGLAKISYIVPANSKNESLFKFLPSSLSDIKSDYYKPFKSEEYTITDYKIQVETLKEAKSNINLEDNNEENINFSNKKQTKKNSNKDEVPPNPFLNKIKVSYIIHFKVPSVLEDTPLKNVNIIYTQKNLVIRRTFPIVSKKLEKNNFLSERIRKYMLLRLDKGSLNYVIKFPANMQMKSNQGITTASKVNFKYNLNNTIFNQNIVNWNLDLKSN